MLHRNGIEDVQSSTANPTGNAVAERVYKTIGDQLRTLLAEHPPNNIGQALELLDNCIASVLRAIRTAIHTTLQVSPGSLVFHQDMLLPIPVLADLDLICQHRQVVINDNNHRALLPRLPAWRPCYAHVPS